MPEPGGLQIEMRCVKCGTPPTTDIALYEMQNHFFICSCCRLEAEHQGKQIAWKQGVQTPVAPPTATPLANMAALVQDGILRTRPLVRPAMRKLPPESIFAILELPLETPIEGLRTALRQQLRAVMREPHSEAKTRQIAQLRQWDEKLQDEPRFKEYCESLRPARKQQAQGAIEVGGQKVLTVQELLDACEISREGWADGERYLSSGVLRQWIKIQLEDEAAAEVARSYQIHMREDLSLSHFRALNAVLYILAPERPFRLYREERWQPRNEVPTASTPAELARLCDIHWSSGEKNLYEGEMLIWLERSCSVQGLSEYYRSHIEGYARERSNRGVGLELLLERVVPGLEKPHLEIRFGNEVGTCTIPTNKSKRWDRELQHDSIPVKITNTTRGFMSIRVELERGSPQEPEWLNLSTRSPSFWSGRPEAGFPVTMSLYIDHLENLRQGRTYKRGLKVVTLGAYGQQPSSLPDVLIRLKTMYFFQGLRGRLWAFGLRGGMPGLLWHFAIGALLGWICLLLIPLLVPQNFHYWYINVGDPPSFGTICEMVLAGLVRMVQLSSFDLLSVLPQGTNLPEYVLPLLVGVLLGIAGFFTGLGKGHKDFSVQLNARKFCQWVAWLCLPTVCILPLLGDGLSSIQQAFIYPSSSDSTLHTLLALQFLCGSILTSILIFLLACIVAYAHYRLEKALCNWFDYLLNPTGRS